MAEDCHAAQAGLAEESRGGGDAPGLGVRHPGDERRTHDRRSRTRKAPDRRRGERRRRRMRTLLLAAATFAMPTHVKIRPLIAVSGAIGAATLARSNAIRAGVSVTLDEFRPIPPHNAYDAIVHEAAVTYDLDPDLIRAVMRTESAFNPRAVSPVGAQGLMQLMPALAEEMGVTDSFDPYQNVMAGARYLRQLLDSHRGNIPLTLASYNAGPGNVKRYKGIPPFRETRNYVKKITNLLKEAATAD